ncbi:hypothetical protein [Hephaestia mangrovi]|uniref:hypothetical protein n=1 Tax=Hephaestia mangrovi TaxID=2873268 RepID=UPI0021057593|nr:hypothetical protein [Hephaestia mangrovi]
MSKIFRSRWSALIWAGGVIWTAYDVAEATAPPAPPAAKADAHQPEARPTDATGTAVSDQDMKVLAKFVGGG